MMTRSSILAVMAVLATLASCSAPTVPQEVQHLDASARTIPYIDGATLPPNIAPVNLYIEEDGEECIVRFTVGRDATVEYVADGWKTDIPLPDWRQLMQAAKGDTLYTDIYVRRGGQWMAFRRMANHVACEEMDEYVTYRLIEPSYVCYEHLAICQRNTTNFEEKVIYDNRLTSDGENGQCMNCHAVQDYNRTGRMQLHLRQAMGGTLITRADGSVAKFNLKTPHTISAGVYPAWHPTMDIIAYSVNETGQVFHTRDLQKVEVIDYASDLVLLDVEGKKLYDVDCGKDDYETFPAWSTDGKTLFYASAHYEMETGNKDVELDNNYQQLHYNIMSRSFDPNTMKFGRADTVLCASAIGQSAVQPRLSPDGRWLLFTMAPYGNFHIWHQGADLCVMDMKTHEWHPLDKANSPASDSFHAWSSNGRWILFASRRDDGNYTRLYISYFDNEGHAHVPVLLPQRDPLYYGTLLKSYNVPEWMVEPSPCSPLQLAGVAKGDALEVQYCGSALQEPACSRASDHDVATGASLRTGRSERVEY